MLLFRSQLLFASTRPEATNEEWEQIQHVLNVINLAGDDDVAEAPCSLTPAPVADSALAASRQDIPSALAIQPYTKRERVPSWSSHHELDSLLAEFGLDISSPPGGNFLPVGPPVSPKASSASLELTVVELDMILETTPLSAEHHGITKTVKKAKPVGAKTVLATTPMKKVKSSIAASAKKTQAVVRRSPHFRVSDGSSCV